MGNLEKTLPKIVGKSLKDEDETTRRLVNVLLAQVFANQNKSGLKNIVTNVLDTEINNAISAGLINIDDCIIGECM